MAFMTVKKNFQKSTLFNYVFKLFSFYLLPSLVKHRSHIALLLSKKGAKANVFEEFLMNLLASTQLFHRKEN